VTGDPRGIQRVNTYFAPKIGVTKCRRLNPISKFRIAFPFTSIFMHINLAFFKDFEVGFFSSMTHGSAELSLIILMSFFAVKEVEESLEMFFDDISVDDVSDDNVLRVLINLSMFNIN